MRRTPLLILVALMWVTSCGHDNPTPAVPTAPSGTTTTPQPTLKGVSITGNVTLTAVGETSQLTATATFTDNSTKDVTTAGRWQGGDSRVLTVSSGGLLTITGLGASWIQFGYLTQGAVAQVTATPPGTFVIAGRVRDPGEGGLSNVEVVDTMSGRSATSDSNGLFSLAGLPAPRAHFRAQPTGYELAEVDATDTNVDLPVQRVVRLTAGETVTPAQLAPNDLTYTVGGNRCSPCRMIRVIVPRSGTVNVHVTWPSGAKLSLFAEGQVVEGTNDLSADVPIGAPREVLMYFGAVSEGVVKAHTAFVFATSMR
jgi:hypothetical protein